MCISKFPAFRNARLHLRGESKVAGGLPGEA